MANSTANVQIGKPKVGGGVWVGSTSATLPTDATTAISTTDFKCVGYCSEDGVTNGKSKTTNDIKAWGGDTVASPTTDKKDTFKWKMIEGSNIDVLKVVHGDTNVSGTLSDGITVTENAKNPGRKAFVVDMQVADNIMKRVVIPHGEVTAIDDVVYKDGEPVGYGVTVTAFPDASGNTHYEYIKQTA